MSKISVVLPLLLPDEFTVAMTRFCLDALRINASGRHEVELVIVETGSKHFSPREPHADIREGDYEEKRNGFLYLHRRSKSTYVLDWNAGADAATGEYLVHIGNDVIVGKDWDAALMEPFERFKDCGMSSTACLESGSRPIGHQDPVRQIVEGTFCAFMCFRKDWRLDDAYEGGYSDGDLTLRMYRDGLRAYRNNASVCYHLNQVTWKSATKDKGVAQMLRGEKIFYERWKGSPWMMYSIIRGASVQYGLEHLAALAPTPYEERMAR